MSEKPAPYDRENAALWVVAALAGGFLARAGLLQAWPGVRAALEWLHPFALWALIVALLGLAIGFIIRNRLAAVWGPRIFPFRVAPSIAGFAGFSVASLLYGPRAPTIGPVAPTPAPSATAAPATATAPPTVTLAPTPSPSRRPTREATATPTAAPPQTPIAAGIQIPQATPVPTPRIDYRAELMAGHPMNVTLVRTPTEWGNRVEIIEGEKYRIQFIPEDCEWRTEGTINHQQDGIVQGFRSRMGPKVQQPVTPLERLPHSEMLIHTDGCQITPEKRQIAILHITFPFDANGWVLGGRDGRLGRLEKAEP